MANPRCYYIFCTTVAAPARRAMRALSLFGVGYLLQTPATPAAARRVRGRLRGPGRAHIPNPEALPRAFLVGRQRVVGDGKAARTP